MPNLTSVSFAIESFRKGCFFARIVMQHIAMKDANEQDGSYTNDFTRKWAQEIDGLNQ